MSETFIQVNPASVRGYIEQAGEIFGSIATALQANVNEMVAIKYDGPNAASFKNQLGTMSVEFANNMFTHMSSIAQAVHAATSNIASSLGGQVEAIEVPQRSIEAPQVTASEIVNVDTTGLEAGKDTATTNFNELRALLEQNKSALAATDWLGNAKNAVVEIVNGLTTTAVDSCTAAETNIHTVIDAQVTSVKAADTVA